MASPPSGPRLMLRRMREIMAETSDKQVRLDRVVVLIANNMVAEVCSVYVVRLGGLELYATEGLKRHAVHLTRLRVGEGLVGRIAAESKPLNLPEAKTHPDFAFRPETGEEVYHSFLGVPIIHGGRTIGVLVVQNRTKRLYTEEEIEALETIAMVLAEIISPETVENGAADEREVRARGGGHHWEGVPIVTGVGFGQVVLHEPRVMVTNLIADNVETETERLDAALGELRFSIDRMLERADMVQVGEHREVIEAYRMFAHDRGWVRRMREAVKTGLTAEAAVERVMNETRARLRGSSDAYIKDRLHDLDDLANRLLRHLVGEDTGAEGGELPVDAIVFARNIGPAELLDYSQKQLHGLVLEDGALTGHAAIVARALGVPFVGRVENILDYVQEGDPVIVDGETGEIHVRPSPEAVAELKLKADELAQRAATYDRLRDVAAVTRDGLQVEQLINAGLLVDLPHLDRSGAQGVGLFRTELQFMVASRLPRLSKQRELYHAVLEAAGTKPVVFRALDIGGDKFLPYMRMEREENPALGWRTIRMAAERPAILKVQLRAFLMAAAGRTLKVMIPFIAEVREFEQARDILNQEMAFLKKHGHQLPEAVKIGALIEVPSILWQLDALLPQADFVSIGSNDLYQYLFAVDRTHPKLAQRYDELSPSMLNTLRHIVLKCDEYGVPLTVCGEMAGMPLEAMALIGLGFTSISMAPNAVGPVKAMILKLDAANLQEYLLPLLDSSRHSLRAPLQEYARAHDVPV
ncbi:MAG: phosphoenolpyruvate--protein phosphotransferase [Hyphomicrobiales bacterium]|nr:MAG: phosphoenolpyruvate--protein phosphotransferase [Hyphomicrobiales bacterium]